MATDIASLVLAIDSTQADKGAAALDNLASKSDKADKAAQTLIASMERQVAVHGKSTANVLRYDASLMSASKTERDRIATLTSTIEKQEEIDRVMRSNAETAKWLTITLTAAATAAAVLFKRTVDAADAMNDMHLKTGLAFKDLAAYDLLARQSGSSLEGVAQGFKFLSKSIIENSDELKQLGVTSKNSQEAMGQFADLIASINDPALKSTLAMKYLGRAGVEMIPVLSGGSAAFRKAREDTAAYGEMLEKMAPAADAFNDEMAKLSTRIITASQSIAIKLLPLLQELVSGASDTADEVGDLGDKFDPLVETFKAVAILGGNVAFVMRGIGIEIGGMAAQIAAVGRGDFAAAGAIGDMMKEDAAKRRANFDDWEKRILNVGAAATAAAAGVKKLTAAEEEAIRTQEERAKAAKKAADQAAKIADDVKKHTEALRLDTEQLGMNEIQQRMMSEAAYALTLPLAKQREVVMAAAAAWALKKQAVDDEAEALKKSKAAAEEWSKAAADAQKAIDSQIESLEKQATTLVDQVTNYGLTKDRIQETIIARLEEKRTIEASLDGHEQLVADLDREIAARRKIAEAERSLDGLNKSKKAAEDATRAWEKFADDLEQSLTDALMRSFESGNSFGETFIDNLKNMIKTAALKLVIQVGVSSVAGAAGQAASNILGINLGGGSSGGMGGVSNLLSLGSNISSMGGISSGFGAFATSGIGQALGLSTATSAGYAAPVFASALEGGALLSAGTGGAAGGLTAAGAGIGAAMPYVAAALAVVSILGGMFGKKSPAPIEWALSDTPIGTRPAGWEGHTVDGPFTAITTYGQHLSRNGMSADKLQAQITNPLAELDKVLAKYLSTDEKARVTMGLRMGYEGEHGYSQAEVEGVMMRRLNNISNAIGGWVDKMADTVTGNLQERYAQIAQILSLRGDPKLERLAEGQLASTGSFGYEQLANLQAGMKQFEDSFYSDAKKVDDTSAIVHKAMEELNLTFPETRDGFRTLVDGIDTGTKAGFELFSILIGIAPAMDSYYDALEAELDVKKQLAATMKQSNFATAVDFTRFQRVSENFDPNFAADYSYNIQRGAITPSKMTFDDVVKELRELRMESKAQGIAVAVYSAETAKTLRRWEGNGMPETRTVV